MQRIRTLALALGTLCVFWNVASRGFVAAEPEPAPGPQAEARRWFDDARFGLAVHWGIDSLLGKGEAVMETDRLPITEYEKLATQFNPTAFDAETWVKTAEAAGARFLAVNAKHHDGFCLFDSKLTRFDVLDATPYGHDPLKDLADACHKHGLKLFLSYSLLDWHHPDYFPRGKTGRNSGREDSGDWKRYVTYYQGQIRELCTHYGAIGGIWLVGGSDRPDSDWDLAGTFRIIHDLQPAALAGTDLTDKPVPGEDVRFLADRARIDPPLRRALLLTLNDSRGYNRSDKQFKSAETLVRALVTAAGNDATLLASIAARSDGTLAAESTERLLALGKWLDKNGATIYGTTPSPIPPQPWGVSLSARRPDSTTITYLHILEPARPVELPENGQPVDVRPFGEAQRLEPRRKDGRLVIDVPARLRTPPDTIVVLTFPAASRKEQR